MCALRVEAFDAINDDKLLALAFKKGDARAYDEIYARHNERVLGICRRMLRQPHDAQEAAQETFLRVFRGLPQFNGRYQLGAWITRIATNVCLDHLRSGVRRPSTPLPVEELDLLDETIPSEDPEGVCIRNAESRHIRRVLESLPPMHKAAIVLRDIEGLTYDEVATALNITDVQVKALIHRARKSFKRNWAQSVASIFLPWRMIGRLRGVDAYGSEPATGALTTGSQVVAECNVALAHCGQFVAERVGAVAAAVVTTAALSTGAIVAYNQQSPPAALAAPVSVASSDSGSESSSVAHGAPARSERKGDGPTAKSDPKDAPVAAPPAEEPADSTEQPPASEPAPQQSAPPGDETSSGGVNGEAPPPSSPPGEPQGFSMSAGLSGIDPYDACSECLLASQVIQETGTDSETGLVKYSQQLQGSLAVDGAAAYGLELTHGSTDMSAHSMTFRVWTVDGSFDFSASGALASVADTDWGGRSYTFTGSFTRNSGASKYTALPASGSYTLTLDFSTTQHRVISTSISLN